MKYTALLLALLLPTTALAQSVAPTSLGTFEGWTAATYGSGANKACYAFTTATVSAPALAKRGPVMLTVTERKSDRDEVTLSAGFDYPAKPVVTLSIGATKIDFYTSGQTAFTSDGALAVASMKHGGKAVAKTVGPSGYVLDTFALSGFSGAYSAISKACP
ncbi:MAG: hypothetical protein B7Z75_11235 [Acidocella sp. 20-57-95]|nr:MAG: hypothetical protein B7Z75_11235 [Acidocella sp. 20-57-95]OYV61887.1 MAG: hypothetical protein B7Z71_03500 [Acidocella sp. 21-58-7]HQT65247.1 hypothetical protein [Acidocella sp.]HQU05221.1 hypothetical protein [Acidocella sp.]